VYISQSKAIYLGNLLGRNWTSPGSASATHFYNAPNVVEFKLPI
jgi:hypothetical protein